MEVRDDLTAMYVRVELARWCYLFDRIIESADPVSLRMRKRQTLIFPGEKGIYSHTPPQFQESNGERSF